MPDREIGIVHLVHGTWGNVRIFGRPSAPRWHESGHPFHDALKRALKGRAMVVSFPWGWGANLQTSRIRAASRLRKEILSSSAGTKHLLIGHSHGGNICLLACADPEVQSKVAGVVTLATPFLLFRKVKYIYLAAAAWFVLWVTGLPWLAKQYGWTPQSGYVEAFALILLMLPMMMGFAALKAGEFAPRDLALPKTLPCKVLILRPAADEASGLLSVAAPLSWIVVKLHQSATRTLNRFAALPIIGLSVATIGATLLYMRLEAYQHWIDIILWSAGIALALGYGGAFLVICALRMPFGWDLAVRGLSYSVSSEASPPGEWKVELVDASSAISPAFAHSGIYGQKAVQAKVIAFARQAMQFVDSATKTKRGRGKSFQPSDGLSTK